MKSCIPTESHAISTPLQTSRNCTPIYHKTVSTPPLTQNLDLLILGVFPEKGNGIQLARRLRKAGNEIPIIFIANTMEFVLDGYTAEPLAYLLKPLEREKLTEALIRAYRKYKKNMMAIQTPSQTVRFQLDEVLYLEICDKTLHIHMADGCVLKATAHLSTLLKKLPQEQFVQCHRSYVVSLLAVSSICRYVIELKNHEKVPVSKTRYKEVQSALLQDCVDI